MDLVGQGSHQRTEQPLLFVGNPLQFRTEWIVVVIGPLNHSPLERKFTLIQLVADHIGNAEHHWLIETMVPVAPVVCGHHMGDALQTKQSTPIT